MQTKATSSVSGSGSGGGPVQFVLGMFQDGNHQFSNRGVGSYGTLGFALGIPFGFALSTFLMGGECRDFWLWVLLMSFFHFTEWFATALYNLPKLSVDSFLINHSTGYTVALMASIIEYWVEYYLFGLTSTSFIMVIGSCIALTGLVVRIAAMHTNKVGFTHIVQDTRRTDHQLCTWGIYKYVRHPGYFGWFWWTIGNQILMQNFVCAAGFAYVSYRFFKDRIAEEEEQMEREDFFGSTYTEYKKRTPTYIPGIL